MDTRSVRKAARVVNTVRLLLVRVIYALGVCLT